MVSLIDHFEYIVVNNEAEALILECNLIKKKTNKKTKNRKKTVGKSLNNIAHSTAFCSWKRSG